MLARIEPTTGEPITEHRTELPLRVSVSDPGVRTAQVPLSERRLRDGSSSPSWTIRITEQTSTFLFESLATITALGESHRDGRAMLHNSWDLSSRGDHYTRVMATSP